MKGHSKPRRMAKRLRKHVAQTLDNMPWIATGLLGVLALSLAANTPSPSLLAVNAALGILFLATYAFSLKHLEWQWLTGILFPVLIPLASITVSGKFSASNWYLLQGSLMLFATFSLLALLLRPYLRRFAGIPTPTRHKKAA
jgi:hypothetical protein